MREKIIQLLNTDLDAAGIFQYSFLETKDLHFSQGVRDLCKMNACGMYNKTWACPPAVGTMEECHERIMKYKNLFVFTTRHDLEDSYDFEGMMDGKDKHEKICNLILPKIQNLLGSDVLLLSAEGCKNCAVCTYPNAPCRFPDTVHPSIESHGVEVNVLAKKAKINYINGANTVTYFGCIFY